MFKISFMVEDKNLPKVLHGLTGAALNLEVVPVTNAVVDRGKVRAEDTSSDGSVKSKFLNYVQKLPSQTVFTTENIKQVLSQIGNARTVNAYGYYVKVLRLSKLAKARGRGQFVRL